MLKKLTDKENLFSLLMCVNNKKRINKLCVDMFISITRS